MTEHMKNQRRIILCGGLFFFGFLCAVFTLRACPPVLSDSVSSFFETLFFADTAVSVPLFVSSWAVLLALFGLSPFGSPFVLLLDFSAGSAFGLLACSFFLLYGFRFLFLAFLGIVFFCYLLISASVFRISSQLFSLVRSASLRLPDLRYAIFRVLFTMVILGASAVCLSLSCRGP